MRVAPLVLVSVFLFGCACKAPDSEQHAGAQPAEDQPSESADTRIHALATTVSDRERSFRTHAPQGEGVDAVRAELRHRFEIDQLLRESFYKHDGLSAGEASAFDAKLTAWVAEVDAYNTRYLQQVLERYNWITIAEFGEQADADAWLLVQHADQQVEFQRRVLKRLEPLVDSGQTSPSNYARLWDRVAVNSGLPQRYGTQGNCVGPGKWEPAPLEDPSRVESLRAAMGLPPSSVRAATAATRCR